MAVLIGDRLPSSTLVRMGDVGPQQITVEELTANRKVIIFGLPGAFTSTCSTAHVPSFIRTHDKLIAKGVDEVICISVNDIHVLKEWSKVTGADLAGISMWADPSSEFTTAIGMNFDVPLIGFIGRSSRYAMLVEGGVVQIFNEETSTHTCDLSTGETMLASIT